MPALLKTPKRFPKSLPHSRQKHAVAYPNPQMYTFIAVYSKHVKLLSKKRMKSQILYMYMQHHFVKDRTMIVNLFLSHSYIYSYYHKNLSLAYNTDTNLHNTVSGHAVMKSFLFPLQT